ncbi:hypothetical protein ACJW31_09G167500 [Castanea mollissima]
MSDNNNTIRWESLPAEIATSIFLRLPIKSIIICTCFSKTWKSQIQNPTFISTGICQWSYALGWYMMTDFNVLFWCSIWVMKEYGVASSWMSFYTADGVFRMAIPWPISFRKNGDAVFILREGQLVSWNRESKEFLRILGSLDMRILLFIFLLRV